MILTFHECLQNPIMKSIRDLWAFLTKFYIASFSFSGPDPTTWYPQNFPRKSSSNFRLLFLTLAYASILSKFNVVIELSHLFLMKNRRFNLKQVPPRLNIQNIMQWVNPWFVNDIHVNHTSTQNLSQTQNINNSQLNYCMVLQISFGTRSPFRYLFLSRTGFSVPLLCFPFFWWIFSFSFIQYNPFSHRRLRFPFVVSRIILLRWFVLSTIRSLSQTLFVKTFSKYFHHVINKNFKGCLTRLSFTSILNSG